MANTGKPIIRLDIGQWWLYRDSKKWDWPKIPENINGLEVGLQYITDRHICAIIIDELVISPYGNEEALVEFMIADEEYSPYLQNDKAWFDDQSFSIDEDYFTPFWALGRGLIYKKDINPIGIQYGVSCVRCKEYYPYAVYADRFKCWPCRNKF